MIAMRIRITLQGVEGNITLPIHYNHALQGFIYNNLSDSLSNTLHDSGFRVNKKNFKLFTFSNILQHGKRVGDKLEFGETVSFFFSSPIKTIIEDISNNLAIKDRGVLWNNYVVCTNIKKYKTPYFQDIVTIQTLSPITIHTTFLEEEDRVNYYYKPTQRKFNQLITKNALNKYNAWAQATGHEPLQYGEIQLIPKQYNPKFDTKYVYYKNTLVIGSTGMFELHGTPRLIWITYETGLGDKNSQGFGMWELVVS